MISGCPGTVISGSYSSSWTKNHCSV